METVGATESAVPKENRQKVMLATRRRRLGSMPGRFAQTDGELQTAEIRRLARTSNSLQIPGFTFHDRSNAENSPLSPPSPRVVDFSFNFLDENEAVCHSPDQSPQPWDDGCKVPPVMTVQRSQVSRSF